MKAIKSVEDLSNYYGEAVAGVTWKEIDHINEHYQQFIEKSPFLVLATYGENGIDCSPRGDPASLVRIVNEKCVQIPDRRGNNRLDSLRNIIHNPNVGLIFLIPNIGETIRLSGKAEILVDEDLCSSFTIKGKAASSVISIQVEKVLFQCSKALVRSKLWNTESHVERNELPSVGAMVENFAKLRDIEFDGEQFDEEYPNRIKETIY